MRTLLAFLGAVLIIGGGIGLLVVFWLVLGLLWKVVARIFGFKMTRWGQKDDDYT